MEEISCRLMALRDAKYADFQRRLTPGVAAESFLGVRVPALRKLAKELERDGLREAFLDELPHRYYDENILHSVFLSTEKDYTHTLARIEAFLPWVNNWAVCDTLRPRVFAAHHRELLPVIFRWMQSKETYTVRFGILCLMNEFLGEDFDPAQAEAVAKLESGEYYVRMMAAWYFATALAKQWDAVIPFLDERRLHDWVHRKTIQKAIESYRITEEQKIWLRSLRKKQ